MGYSVLVFSRQQMTNIMMFNDLAMPSRRARMDYPPFNIGLTTRNTLVPFTSVVALPEALDPIDMTKLDLRFDDARIVGIVDNTTKYHVLYQDTPQAGFADLGDAARKVRDRIIAGKDPLKRPPVIRNRPA